MKTQTVRIIAGKFRSRKIHFPDAEGLRPTPDRVKETLFNWLRSDILDARCLDLFAGSGALGFEAVSRGAKEVVMVDASRAVIAQLQQTAQALTIDNVHLIQAAFPQVTLSQSFDIVFIDPPFHCGLAQQALDYLIRHPLLSPHARVYVETEKAEMLTLPEQFELLKDEVAGDVRFRLYGVTSPASGNL